VLDWPAVRRRQDDVIQRLRPTPGSLERAGITVHLGSAQFIDVHTVAIDGARVYGEKIVIGAGSAPIVPPLPGREIALTSDQLLLLDAFPPHLILVGAGVIGLEMAGAFSDLGAEVTVIGQEQEILPMFDADVAAYIRTLLATRGVRFELAATVTAFEGRRGDVRVRFERGGTSHTVGATQACLAVGRRWDPRTLGADSLGLETNRLGLRVSPQLQTSVPHIYAAGDAAGNVQLTPTAAYEGRVAARNALTGGTETADYSVVPQTVFTTPEIAKVGPTYREARARGIRCEVVRHDMRGNANGVATGEEGGYLKILFQDERVLGVQMVNYAAAELIQLAALAIRCRATADVMASQLSVHPSHTERLIKVTAHEYHEVCEVELPPPP
jgi:pyruvate/2-oxoglutarate dehydrogenase complex dihydrolipoamide dehydrogenase (E3) component